MKLEEINERIEELTKQKELLLRSEITSTDSIDDMIFKLYIKFENVQTVADKLNSMGYKRESQSGKLIKYVSTDISSVITNKSTNINDKELFDYVVKAFNRNKKYADRWN